MNFSKIAIGLFLSLLVANIGNAQTTDILADPVVLPLEEKGLGWDQPLVTVTGRGEFKIEDAATKVSYEGIITCTVAVSAQAAVNNRLEIKLEEFGREVDAKSKMGSIDITACTVTDANNVTTAIAETAAMTDSRVEVEIEGLYEDLSGTLVFSEYEAEGKINDVIKEKVKLELENGSVSVQPSESIIFVTSAKSTGDLGGLSGADATCQAAADSAFLPGSYKAWLSDSTTSAKARLTNSIGPYVRTDGVQIAADFASLIDGPFGLGIDNIDAFLNVDENGVMFTGTSQGAWTGTNVVGESTNRNCTNWTFGSFEPSPSTGDPPFTATLGFTFFKSFHWTEAGNISCGQQHHLYCLQQ